MSRNFFLPVIFSILVSSTLSGQIPFTFGRVNKAEMDVEYYRQKYPGESAVIIGDVGNCVIRPDRWMGFVLLFEREYRVMILNEEGLRFGNYSIPVFETPWQKERIKSFRAHVYNIDEKREIQRTRINSRAGLTVQKNELIKETTFSFPDVKPGSIVEIRYTLESFSLFNLRNWYFQNTIPVEYSEFNLNMHPWYKYLARFKGSFDLDINEQIHATGFERFKDFFTGDGRNIRYRWVARNIDPLKEEPFTDNLKNYLGHIFFELVSFYPPNRSPVHYSPSWSHAAYFSLRQSNFGGYLNASERLTMDYLPDEPFENHEDAIEYAIKTIHNYVKWNQINSRRAYSISRSVLERGFGNSAEVNLLLVALLRNLELDAFPVALSTVDNGALFSDSPTISQWNYIVAVVILPDGTQVLLDATVPKPVPGFIPLRTQNGRMRIIDLEHNDWVTTEGISGFNEFRTFNLTLDDSGNLTGNLEIIYEDYGAYLMLQQLELAGEKDITDRISRQTGANLSNVIVENTASGQICVSVKADISIPAYAQWVGEEMLIPAMLFETITENPFWSEERLYPVKYPYTNTVNTRIDLQMPDGFRVSYLPENKSSTWGGFMYRFEFSETENKINIVSHRQRASRTVYTNQYSYFKSHKDKMIVDNIDNIIFSPE